MFMTNLPPNYYIVLQIPDTATDEEIRRSYKDLAKLLHPDKNLNDPNATATFQLLQEAYETLSDPLKRQNYDTFHRHILYHQACEERQSHREAREARREEGDFDPEYEHRKHRDGMRRFSRSPKKPPPTAAELERRARQEKEWKKQLRREERSWEKAERKYAKAESERVKERVKKEGPIPEWLEGVVEVDGDVAGDKPVAMEGETLIDFEDDLMRFDSREEAKPDEFARSGERERRRGSLGSHGRKASKEAESEWDIFFDRFESLKVLMELY